MEYYSAIKKEVMPFAATQMDLQVIILSEVSQTRYCMILLICRISKNDTSELNYKMETDSQT